MKPHKHAALMAEYAKDAAETDTPWERWELKHSKEEGEWMSLVDQPNWHNWAEYRRKPRTININGHEVPEPMRTEPDDGSEYYSPSLTDESCYDHFNWRGDKIDEGCFSVGFCHSTKEAAIAHAKALISFTAKP
jgi:hypothetical protein